MSSLLWASRLLLLQLWPAHVRQEMSKLLSAPDSDVGCRCQAVQGSEPLRKPLMLASSWCACGIRSQPNSVRLARDSAIVLFKCLRLSAQADCLAPSVLLRHLNATIT